MATSRCDHGHLPPVLQDPLDLPVRPGAPFSWIAVRGLGPLIGTFGALWSPVEHAAGFSGRDRAVGLCLVGAMKLIRRRLRPQGRWDAVPGRSGGLQPGAW